MKILLVHNRYQLPGGEDEVLRRERELLARHGHDVIDYTRDNQEIAHYSLGSKASLALRTTWAWDSYSQMQSLVAKSKPEIVHFHNTFPLISPAAYYACAAARIPVVQTLHNPRLLCPAATLFRDGAICEACVGRTFALPAIRHACYQRSRARSAAVASMVAIHRWLGTWKEKVNCYIASTDVYRRKFAAAGLPATKIVIKPHFVAADPGCSDEQGKYALFIGRLAPEKGVLTLATAWQKVRTIPLYVRGDGPSNAVIEKLQTELGNVVVRVPRLNQEDLFALLKSARFLVWPSEGLYESFGLVAIEAFACGIPVIASRSGVMQEIVRDGETGLHFNPGDAEDLANKVQWAWGHPLQMREMGLKARVEYDVKYTATRNYQLLLKIYQDLVCRDPHVVRTPELGQAITI